MNIDETKKNLKFVFNNSRARSANEDFVPLHEQIIAFNANIKCDMYKGPCSCGAWHKPGDIEKKFIWVFEEQDE